MNKPETDSIWVSLVDELLLILMLTLVGSVVKSIRRDSNTKIEADGVCFTWSEPRLVVMMIAARLWSGDIVIVFAFVCCYNSFRIMWCPLHVFSHWASRSCALVIAPTKKGINTLRTNQTTSYHFELQVLLVYVHLSRKSFVVVRTWDLGFLLRPSAHTYATYNHHQVCQPHSEFEQQLEAPG